MIRVQKYNSPCGILVLASFEDKFCLCDCQMGKRHQSTIKRLKQRLKAKFIKFEI
ncbi:MAG: hypothetical protein Q4Q06_07795 [Bacteroidota bacterium]|nr:hypothetical protein [Bacteroidota bacterium]